MGITAEQNVRRCHRCGAPLAGDELAGNCPRCLSTILLGDDPANHPDLSWMPECRRVGDYELLEEIARGGMGVVFRARQISLDRAVAVKLLRDSALARPEDVKRFRAEAASVARLKHPNIVAIHEVGEDHGQHYLAMDLVEGPNLAEFTRAGPLESRRAAEITARIADAVQHAHAQGILHRDLKPSNVLMDAEGEVFVTDFGLARPLDTGSSLTMTGQVLGTPAFMSPEQAIGLSQGVGPTADVYSLGALLFHLVTSRPPFVSTSLPELMRLVAKEEPLSPQLLNSSVPRDLATVCLKCLAKRPADRYGSAREFAEDLRRYLRNEPVRARPASHTERLWRWCRREPALAASLGFALFVLIIGVTASTWQWRRAEREAHSAKEELWHSQLMEARSYRLNGGPGQRIKTLEVVAQAAAYRPSVELRNEAIAALVLPDLGSNVWWHAEDNPAWPKSFTSDFEFFVPAKYTGRVSVCRASDQQAVVEFEGLGKHAVFVQFSPDDRLLAARFDNGAFGVWDWREQRLLFRAVSWEGHDELRPSDFTPDGRELWLCGPDQRLARYSLPEGRSLAVPPADVRASGLRLDGSGSRLLAVEQRRVSAWDITTSKPLGEWTVTNQICSLAWHPDGRRFAISVLRFGLLVGEIGLPELEAVEGSGGSDVLTRVSFTPDGSLILAGGWGDAFGAWDSATHRQVLHSREGYFVEINRAGSEVAISQAGRGYGVRRFLNPVGVRRVRLPGQFAGGVYAAAWHPGGRWLIAGHELGWTLWDVAEGNLVAQRGGVSCRSVQFLPNGKGFIIGGVNGPQFWPFELVDGKPRIGESRNLLPANSGATQRAAVSQDGEHFAAVGAKGAFLGRLAGDSQPIPIPGGAGNCYVQFSPDGQWICISDFKGTNVNLHSALTGALVTNLPTGGFVAWFVPGRNELMANSPSEMTRWELGTWKLLRRMTSRERTLPDERIGFWPDGRCALVSGRDQMLRLWDLEAGREIAALRLPEGSAAWSGVFDPAAERMVTTGGLPYLRVWDFVALRRELRELGLDWLDAEPGHGFVRADGTWRTE